MTRPDDLEPRVLAGGADRDVEQIRGEIRDFRRATTASFNALREDLVDLRSRMDDRFAKVDDNFAKVDIGFLEVRGKLDAAAAGQQQIVDLLTTVIDQQGGR